MSIETTPVEELGRELGETIAELPEYEAFLDAKRAVESSDAAQEKIDAFEREREEFLLARQSGTATQDDLVNLQRTQQELHEITEMATYLEAQQAFDARLAAIDDAISEPLSVEFGEHVGGCCHD